MTETIFSDNTNIVEIPSDDLRHVTQKIDEKFTSKIPCIPTTVVWNNQLIIEFSPASNYPSEVSTSKAKEHSVTKHLKFKDAKIMKKNIDNFMERGMRLSAMYIHADNKKATCTFTSF